jgi:hypothetical protein
MINTHQKKQALTTLQLFQVPPPYTKDEITKIAKCHAFITQSLESIPVKRDQAGSIDLSNLFFQAAETAARGRPNGYLLLLEACNEIKASRSNPI